MIPILVLVASTVVSRKQPAVADFSRRIVIQVRGADRNGRVVVDSRLSRDQALGHNSFPKSFLDRMEVVTVFYRGFDGLRHEGQIVVERAVAKEVRAIFDEIEASGYRIRKVVPIVAYGWSDSASIADDNTSAFNYRHVIVPGQTSGNLSAHSYGRAIDLNPKENPFVSASGSSPRPYNTKNPATLTLQSSPVKIFIRHGWKWGGQWKGGRDYQHFSKAGADRS